MQLVWPSKWKKKILDFSAIKNFHTSAIILSNIFYFNFYFDFPQLQQVWVKSLQICPVCFYYGILCSQSRLAFVHSFHSNSNFLNKRKRNVFNLHFKEIVLTTVLFLFFPLLEIFLLIKLTTGTHPPLHPYILMSATISKFLSCLI